jgi:peroxiredoxin
MKRISFLLALLIVDYPTHAQSTTGDVASLSRPGGITIAAGKVKADLTALLPGKWRGVFTIRDGVEIPFNFEILADGKGLSATLINGEERFPTGVLSISGDSAFIPLPLFDNELAVKVTGNILTGTLRRQDLRGRETPLQAVKDAHYRFVETGNTPVRDISGRYDVTFTSANGHPEKAVGIFRQHGNKLQATFLRVTGDSRYLEGLIEDNHLQLSSFIGSGPSYYRATVGEDGHLQGESVNARGGLPFTAVPDKNAALPDAYTLTTLKEGVRTFAFSFPDADGKTVSSTDARFAGKPLIITIGGTWCPNCMDEASFLGPWYEKNKDRGIEVVALQYERDTDPAAIKKVFARFRKQYRLQYPLLLGGIADKQAVVASLPALNNFLSFPTTLFVGRDGQVKKIHTGFSGPATGEEYEKFISEFNEEADRLITDK